jgi:integrase
VGNERKGKFSPDEAELIFASLPVYMGDIARFAYETGARAGEILKLKWSYLTAAAINVPAAITKNRTTRTMALTDELLEIIARRRKARVPGCDLIFHNEGRSITDYRDCWYAACVANGLGAFYCRTCRDEDGNFVSVLVNRKCGRCGKKWRKRKQKYVGKLFHDFRRSASHEMWLGGSSIEDCMKVTGHKTPSMFKRYADLFTDDELRARQLAVQNRRRQWRDAQQPANVVTMPQRTAIQ